MEEDPQLSERRAAIDAATVALRGVRDRLWEATGAELGPLLEQVDELGRLVEAARVAIVSEAIGRGETGGTHPVAHASWTREWAPSTRAGGSARLVEVALACQDPAKAAVAEAVLGARLPVHNASVCLAEMHRLSHRLTADAVPTVWAALVALGEGAGPAQIRRLRPALLAKYGRLGELDDDHVRAAMLMRLSQPAHGGDGLHEYTLLLDDASTAILEAALGPVAAPCPTDDIPDLRPSGQRRADALVTLIRRAVANPDGVPTSPKAQLIVTMDYGDLTRELAAGATVAGPGAGTLLGPDAVRRLACDAGIIPAVLASPSEVLDLGKETRFYTGAQAKALWLRDRHCTMPGCTMPAQWCDAHHLWHWSDGGPTDLGQGALLCGHHHTWVHRHRLHGHVVGGSVCWDLTPGSYDTFLARMRARPRAVSPLHVEPPGTPAPQAAEPLCTPTPQAAELPRTPAPRAAEPPPTGGRP